MRVNQSGGPGAYCQVMAPSSFWLSTGTSFLSHLMDYLIPRLLIEGEWFVPAPCSSFLPATTRVHLSPLP